MFSDILLASYLVIFSIDTFFVLRSNDKEAKQIKKIVLLTAFCFIAGTIYGDVFFHIPKRESVQEKIISDIASLKQKVITMQMREHIRGNHKF